MKLLFFLADISKEYLIPITLFWAAIFFTLDYLLRRRRRKND